MTNLIANRERAFFVYDYDLEAAKKIFMIKEDELIIDASAPDSVTTLLKALTEFKGQKIFYIMAGKWLKIQQFLIRRNFVEYSDFISAVVFLPEKFSFKEEFDTRPLVRAM